MRPRLLRGAAIKWFNFQSGKLMKSFASIFRLGSIKCGGKTPQILSVVLRDNISIGKVVKSQNNNQSCIKAILFYTK